MLALPAADIWRDIIFDALITCHISAAGYTRFSADIILWYWKHFEIVKLYIKLKQDQKSPTLSLIVKSEAWYSVLGLDSRSITFHASVVDFVQKAYYSCCGLKKQIRNMMLTHILSSTVKFVILISEQMFRLLLITYLFVFVVSFLPTMDFIQGCSCCLSDRILKAFQRWTVV